MRSSAARLAASAVFVAAITAVAVLSAFSFERGSSTSDGRSPAADITWERPQTPPVADITWEKKTRSGLVADITWELKLLGTPRA